MEDFAIHWHESTMEKWLFNSPTSKLPGTLRLPASLPLHWLFCFQAPTAGTTIFHSYTAYFNKKNPNIALSNVSLSPSLSSCPYPPPFPPPMCTPLGPRHSQYKRTGAARASGFSPRKDLEKWFSLLNLTFHPCPFTSNSKAWDIDSQPLSLCQSPLPFSSRSV